MPPALLRLWRHVLNLCLALGIGTHFPEYITIVIEDGVNCLKACGRNIAMNPIIVPKRSRAWALDCGCLSISFNVNKGNMSAPRLSALAGNVFLTPRLTFLKNGVTYNSSLHPSSVKKLLTCVSYPKMVLAEVILGCNINYAI